MSLRTLHTGFFVLLGTLLLSRNKNPPKQNNMDISDNLLSLIDFEALIQGLLLGIILIARNKKNRPSALLGWFLIFYSSDLFDVILRDTYLIADYPRLIFLPFNFYYLSVPLLYLYAKSLITNISLKRHLWLLVPGMIEFLVFTILFFLPVEKKIELALSDVVGTAITVYQFVSLIFSLIFAFLTIQLIDRHQERVLDYYSNVDSKLLVWLKRVAQVIVVFYSLWVLFFIIPEMYEKELLRIMLSISNVVFIFWVGISGLLQLKVETHYQKAELFASVSSQEVKVDPIDLAEELALFETIKQKIEADKLFKDAELTLPKAAKIFGISRWSLSKMINKHAGVNFSRFINGYRVAEAQKVLHDDAYDHLNMLGIACEVGFSSKATFFAVFKQINGNSPGNYKKQNKKKKDS